MLKMERVLFLLTAFGFYHLNFALRPRPCLNKLRTPRGSFGYPAEEEDECESCFWQMRLKKKQSLRIMFSTIDLRKSIIKIQGKRFAKDEYETISVITGMDNKEVIIEPPKKFVRVIMDGVDGYFRAHYEVFYCALPPPMFNEGECSNFGYRKYSKCNFKCNSWIGYFPKTPGAMNINARCKGNQMWSEDFETKCVGIPEFEETCFGNEKCSFNDLQLKQVFEHQMDLERYLPVVLPSSSVQEDTPDSLTNLLDPVDLRSLICDGVLACDKQEDGLYDVQMCGRHPVRDFVEPCFVCRHILKACIL